MARADESSLYRGPGPRPGPDLLYEQPAVAPQLTNAGVWHAPPILVSGASAYRDGEYLWQGWLFDDHGAEGHVLGSGTDNGDFFSWADGTYQYPTDPAYADDAADLVEFRVKPLADATAFRLTFNAMKDPSLVGTTIALGGTPGKTVPWPYGAAVSSPADFFLTVHGDRADLRRANGSVVDAHVPVTIDLERRQIEVDVPHGDWDPGSESVRMAGGVGLWDKAINAYMIPTFYGESATQPSGAGFLSNPPAFFELMFRFEHQEPDPVPTVPDAFVHPGWWRDSAQAQALASGDVSGFSANVDFGKLAAGVDDNMADQPQGVPTHGAMDRIYASHTETEQGRDFPAGCAPPTSCQGELRSRLQPYAIYVPAKKPGPNGYGLTLLLHSLTANYNQFEGTRNQSEFGDRANPSIVITPEGRGPDGWYFDEAGADTFEVWADVAARYHLDPAYTDISGYSMGGYATYKFASQFPDLFAAAQPVVGPPSVTAYDASSAPGNTLDQLASVRNVPFLIWNGTEDELVPFVNAQGVADQLDSLGYRYEFDAFAPAEHLTFATNDEYAPAAAFLGDKRIDYDPPHVTYAYKPTMDFPADGTAAGHAYWVSDLALRDPAADSGVGTIDVFSHGFGVGDPPASATQRGAGALTGGRIPAIAYESQSRTWGAAPAIAKADVLDIHATNVRRVAIDVARAHVDCDVKLHVTSDGPLQVLLPGCPATG